MKTLIEKILKNEEFLKKEFVILGQECILITPREIGVSWDAENKFFRSVLIKKSDRSVISSGFGKFMNLWEKPEFEPWNESWEFEARHKIDGSLILISKFMGELLIRTRGAISVFSHETGDEFKDLINKYPALFDNVFVNSEQYTVLCEHVTPNRVIILRESSEPELILLGIIQNKSARLETQYNCDVMAESWGVKRPKKYSYSSVQECLDDVKAWQDKEGVVLYHEPTQTLKKIKADLYLKYHKIRSGFNSISNLIDWFFDNNYSFSSLDWEISQLFLSKIDAIQKEFEFQKEAVEKIVTKLSLINFPSRKDYAIYVIQNYVEFKSYLLSVKEDGRINFLKNRIKSILKG